LLLAHKILIIAALVLSALLLLWGGIHWLARGEGDARVVFFLGALALPLGTLYARKLWRSPPIH
jgi:hypothetical protein